YEIRKKRFFNLLDQYQKDAPDKYRKILTNEILKLQELFVSSFEKRSKKIVTEKPLSFEKKDQYSFDMLVNMLKEQNQLNDEYQMLKMQNELENQAISKKNHLYNNELQQYQNLDQPSYDKLILGIQLMEMRLSIALASIQQDKNQKKLQLQNQMIDLKETEISYAKSRLVFPKDFKEDLEKEISEKHKLLTNYSTKIDALYDQITYEREKNLLSQKFLLLSQEYLLQNILYNSLILDIQLDQLSLEFYKVFQKTKEKQSLFDFLDQIQTKIDKIQNQYKSWQKEAQFRYNQVLDITDNQAKKSNANKLLDNSKKIMVELQKLQDKLDYAQIMLQELVNLAHEKHVSLKDKVATYYLQAKIKARKVIDLLHYKLFNIGETVITLWKILKFFLIIIVGYYLSKYSKRILVRLGMRHEALSASSMYTLSRLMFYVIFGFSILFASLSIGLDLTAFAYIAGALSIGIGFGLQYIFSNFIAGIILLLEKNIRIGDFIQLESGEQGTVMAINVRTTLIKTLDNLEILVPNSDLVLKRFTNWTLSEKIRRVRIQFGVSYDADKDKVRKIIIEAAKKVPITLSTRPPLVWLKGFGDSSIDFELIVWVNEYQKELPPESTTSRYLWAIETALKENNIDIPYPVREVFVHTEDKHEK
ncbi:MAG TPA: mechanosensitive ion channel, partial [Chlamydiales bacterium]|nr:mechanosensitive ion channel [Chlamydiales bacterium]